MITAERIKQSLVSGQWTPSDSSLRVGNNCGQLLPEQAWDSYNLDSLFCLKEVYPKESELGFLLRHYWIPATELCYRQSSRLTTPDGNVDQREAEIHRRMVRCQSDHCLWREKTLAGVTANGNGTASGGFAACEMLCCYNCYEQTYRSSTLVSSEPRVPIDAVEAGRQALCRLPIIVPPGPVPLGFSWYGRVGNDYMNYRVATEEHLDEMSLLAVRREGRYTVWPSQQAAAEDQRSSDSLVIERKGITLFAVNRSVVLEDRFVDRVIHVGDHVGSYCGTTNQVVMRLIYSRPVDG